MVGDAIVEDNAQGNLIPQLERLTLYINDGGYGQQEQSRQLFDT